MSGDHGVDVWTNEGCRTHHGDGKAGMDLGGGPQDLLDGQQITDLSLIRVCGQGGVFGHRHRVGRRRAIRHGTRDDDQARDASSRGGDHHGLDLADCPLTPGPRARLEVGCEVGAGCYVDQRVNAAQGGGQIGRAEVNHAPVRPLGTATLGIEPDHGANGTP